MPHVPVLVHDEVRLPHPAAAVWELLTDPAREHEMASPAHVRSFTVPGTPVDTVGQLQCTVLRQPNGAWVGMLSETEERVEGARLVVRSLSGSHDYRETVELTPEGDHGCVVRWSVATRGHPDAAAVSRDRLADELHLHLTRVAAALAGRGVLESWSPTGGCPTTEPLDDVDVVVSASMRATPDAAWSVVAAGESHALESAYPDALGFVVPGSRAGEVGELVCVVPELSRPAARAVFWEVVGLDPGRSVVSRSLSTDPVHAPQREITVVPDDRGVEVTFRVRVASHRRGARAERRRLTAVGERYLEGVRSTLEV